MDNRSKLTRKRIKKHVKGVRPLRSTEPGLCTPTRSNSSRRQDSSCEDSPFSYLGSQAANQDSEVYWDYDTPQIRKYRARMGVGVRQEESSPIQLILPVKAATPEYKLYYEPKVDTEPPIDTAAAQAAFNDLVALNELFDKNKKKSRKNKVAETSTPSTVLCDNELQQSPRISPENTSIVVASESDMFSDDDDSLLVRCTQELEDLQTQKSSAAQSKPSSDENLAIKAEEEIGFESDDSFDMIMSQMDETELVIGKVEEKKSLANKRPLGLLDTNTQTSTPNDRSMKRYKSSDYGQVRSNSTSLRRVHSSPVIPAETTQQKLCTQAEIERKKYEAKRRRQTNLKTKF